MFVLHGLCADAKVLSCGAEFSTLSSIPWFQVKKEKKKNNPQTIVFLHILLVAGIPVLIKWLLSLHIAFWGSHAPLDSSAFLHSKRVQSVVSAFPPLYPIISSIMNSVLAPTSVWRCFFFPWKSTTVRSPGTGLLGFHMVCLLTQLQSGSGPASVSTFHRSHADVTLVFYSGDFYLFIYFNPKKE